MHLIGPPPQGCCAQGAKEEVVDRTAFGFMFVLAGLFGLLYFHEYFLSGTMFVGGVYMSIVNIIHYRKLKEKK